MLEVRQNMECLRNCRQLILCALRVVRLARAGVDCGRGGLGPFYSRRFASFAVSFETAEGLPWGVFYARDERATSAAKAIARLVSESLGEFVERGATDCGAEQCLQLRGVGE
jgi:hypothetical protein